MTSFKPLIGYERAIYCGGGRIITDAASLRAMLDGLGVTLQAVGDAVEQTSASTWTVDRSDRTWRQLVCPRPVPITTPAAEPLPDVPVPDDQAQRWADAHAAADDPHLKLAAANRVLDRLVAGYDRSNPRVQQLAVYRAARPVDVAHFGRYVHDLHNWARANGGRQPLTPEQSEIAQTFQRVSVISLKRTPDRLADFRADFPADWPYLPPVVIEGTDGFAEPPQPGWNNAASVWGCMRSFQRALGAAIAQGVTRPILVMEDDCQFTADAVARLPAAMANLPDDWELLFIGGQHYSPSKPCGIDGLVRCRETCRTHCVAIHPRAFKMLLDAWKAYPSHVDHCLMHLAKTDDSRRFYAVDPFIAVQRANWSTIMQRMTPARSWDSRVAVVARDPASVPVVLLQGTRGQIDALRDAGDYHTGYWRDGDTGYDHGLVDIATLPAAEQPAAFAKWLRVVREEAAAFPSAAVGVWHPDIEPATLDTALTLIR